MAHGPPDKTFPFILGLTLGVHYFMPREAWGSPGTGDVLHVR